MHNVFYTFIAINKTLLQFNFIKSMLYKKLIFVIAYLKVEYSFSFSIV